MTTATPHLDAMIDAAGLETRDARGLMPLSDARKKLARKKKLARGASVMRGGRAVWDADVLYAALCSLEDATEFVKVASRLVFEHPPRGRDNLAFHERYGDAILPWIDAAIGADGAVPAQPWCLLPCLSCIGGDAAAEVALRVRTKGPSPYFGSWLARHAEGWGWLASRVDAEDARALEVLRAITDDDPGAAAEALDGALGVEAARALRAQHGLADGPTDEKVRACLAEAATADVPRGATLTMARLREHFREFAYPMWDNVNYFCGAMRVTGYADPARGDTLVFEALVTGLGSGNLRIEVWRLGGARVMRPVHTRILLAEDRVHGPDGRSLLTGLRIDHARREAVADGELRRTARVDGLDADVPIRMDTSRMKPEVAAAFAELGGPEAHLLVRLGQDHRDRLFAAPNALAQQAGLSPEAVSLFRFDGFDVPLAGDPPTASSDLVAMVEALRTRRRLTRLPRGGNPLAGLYDRLQVCKVGGWGDARLLPPIDEA